MSHDELQPPVTAEPLLTISARLERLFSLMVAWWAGLTLAEMAREHGLSRQRVGKLLAGVDCTLAARRRADHDRPDTPQRACAARVAAARAALLHPRACRLTVRQRAALAWQAQGLVLVDIARRMSIAPRGVCRLQAAAHRRLARLAPAGRMAAGAEAAGPTPPQAGADEIASLDVADLQACRLPETEAAGRNAPASGNGEGLTPA